MSFLCYLTSFIIWYIIATEHLAHGACDSYPVMQQKFMSLLFVVLHI